MNRTLIESYAAGGDRLAEAIKGLGKAELDAFPVPGTWSIRQIVLHVVDSDLVGSERMKRVIAEENPPLVAFDESAWAKNLFYQELDAAAACELFRANRSITAGILRRLPDEAFERSGNHSERGKVTLAEIVNTFTDHLDHHMKFIQQKRKLLGK
jgi:uncharacterized damage-inducible protein DinB